MLSGIKSSIYLDMVPEINWHVHTVQRQLEIVTVSEIICEEQPNACAISG